MAEKKWEGTTFGNSLMHRWLIGILKGIDIRMVYFFTYLFVIPPCLFRSSFKPIWHTSASVGASAPSRPS